MLLMLSLAWKEALSANGSKIGLAIFLPVLEHKHIYMYIGRKSKACIHVGTCIKVLYGTCTVQHFASQSEVRSKHTNTTHTVYVHAGAHAPFPLCNVHLEILSWKDITALSTQLSGLVGEILSLTEGDTDSLMDTAALIKKDLSNVDFEVRRLLLDFEDSHKPSEARIKE